MRLHVEHRSEQGHVDLPGLEVVVERFRGRVVPELPGGTGDGAGVQEGLHRGEIAPGALAALLGGPDPEGSGGGRVEEDERREESGSEQERDTLHGTSPAATCRPGNHMRDRRESGRAPGPGERIARAGPGRGIWPPAAGSAMFPPLRATRSGELGEWLKPTVC